LINFGTLNLYIMATIKPTTKSKTGSAPATGKPINPVKTIKNAENRGKMFKMGGMKKYQLAGETGFERRQAKKIAKAQTRATVAQIEGEGTVADKRNNRAERISVATGTRREKKPKTLSTSTSTSTSNSDNSNSGNTYNTNSSGSTSGSESRSASESTSGSTSRGGNAVIAPTNPSTPGSSPNNPRPTSVPPTAGKMKRGGLVKRKTGGMVNANAKVQALKKAGSNGVKSGTNPKAKASAKATGRSGGTSKAPKTATPKAKYGMVMRRK